MTDETFNRIVSQIKDWCKYVYIGGMGEFTIHPHFKEYVEELHKFAKINLATNLTTIKDLGVLELIDDLSVSISAGDSETYKRVHGKDYFKIVIENLKTLREIHKKPFSVTFVLNSINKDSVNQAREVLGEFGPKTLAMSMRDRMRWLMVEPGRFSIVDGSAVLNKPISGCREMWNTMYFLANGDVTFCCYDYNGTWSAGNINDANALDLWNGQKYTQLRENHLAGNFHRVCLEQCSLP